MKHFYIVQGHDGYRIWYVI